MTATRTPPNDQRAEESLLGAMLLSRDAIAAGIETVTGDDFYRPAHGHIFDVIVDLYGRGDPADPVTVAAELKGRDQLGAIGGESTLLSLQVNTPSTTTAGRYGRIIADHASRRRLIAVGNDIASDGYENPDPDLSIQTAEQRLIDVALTRQRLSELRTVGDAFAPFLDRLEQLYESGGGITGLRSGFEDLDRKTLGFEPGNLIILGARPSIGKSAWALNVATSVAIEQNMPVLFATLEMSEHEVLQRLTAGYGNVALAHLREGTLTAAEWKKVSFVTGQVADKPLVIEAVSTLTVQALRARARRVKQRYGQLGLIVVDYVQLMTGTKHENRQVEIAEIGRGLKVLAADLNTPVLALSQVSRGVESRAEKRPNLSDLRESGELEQSANIVLFLYRDEIYNPESPDRGTAEVIIGKNRQGPTGTVRLAWLEHYTKFANMARSI